jgi:1-aminocyclopropane-1-carboxylate deaminase
LTRSPEHRCRWSINCNYHFGGFVKTDAELHTFIQTFAGNTGIALEPVYTGKMLYGIYDLVRQGYFPSGTRIVALHTGGLQGNRGFSNA